MKWLIRNELPHNEAGYDAPEILDLNEEEGMLDLSDEKEGEVEVISENEIFPEKIVLKLKIKPVPCLNAQWVEMHYLGESYGQVSIYDSNPTKPIIDLNLTLEKAYFKAIDLLETGAGWYQLQGQRYELHPFLNTPFQIESKENEPFYRKRFETSDYYQRIQYNPKIRFLMPFGGVFYPGITPQDAQQVYFEVLRKQDQSFDLGFTAASLWRERGVIAPQRGQYDGKAIHFVGNMKRANHLSLGASLAGGDARFFVHLNDIPASRLYVSQNYQVPGGHPELIEVTFVPHY